MSNILFDNTQWDFALRRYQRSRDFLREIIVEEIQEKINDHGREFAQIALIAKDAQSWAEALPFAVDAIEINDTLPIAQNHYDLVLHLHALHRVNDPVGQMVQVRLALKPDGVFMAAFLGGESLQELRFAFHQAEAEIYNGASPHVAPMIEIKDAGNLLSRAGFALPIADNIKREVRYQSLNSLMHDLRDLGLTNPLNARRKSFSRAALFAALDRHYRSQFSLETGQIYASFEEIFLTGYAPSQDQPQPLRPGSITKSFGVNMEN